MSQINQKEYLKKYLSAGKKKKKKDKNHSKSRLKIIDYDSETFSKIVKEDLMGENEDAPQIVEIIDDRPPSLMVDEKNSKMWIPIGGDPDISVLQLNKLNNPDEQGDMSPPRRNRNSEKRSHEDEDDMSPPRRKPKDENTERQSKRYLDDKDDMSPPRRKHKDENRDRQSNRYSNDKDDMSPPRRKLKDENKDRKSNRYSNDMSPPRKKETHRSTQKEFKIGISWNKTKPSNKLTSDRKKDSSSKSSNCSLPTEDIKPKIENLIKNTSNEDKRVLKKEICLSNADSIHKAWEEQKSIEEKKKQDELQKQKYSRWGMGLKQFETISTKKIEEEIEMSKPLARYAEDADLEQYLKDQEREGDPMLAYIRKKKRKEQGVDKKITPVYMGTFMPNRFGIKPGHRWDGVDRSNGYEVRWFEAQNSKLALKEESYKWSTEDM